MPKRVTTQLQTFLTGTFLDAVMCGFSLSQCHRCVDRCNIDSMNKGASNIMEATSGDGWMHITWQKTSPAFSLVATVSLYGHRTKLCVFLKDQAL